MRALYLASIGPAAPTRRPGLPLILGVSLLAACGDSGDHETSGATDDTTPGSATDATDGADTGDTVDEPTTDPTGTTPTTDPALPNCGDGKLDPGEQCDDGDANGDGAACSADCVQQRPCTDALTLRSRLPAGQGGLLAADAAPELEFACSVDPATVDDATVAVYGSQSGRRAFTVEWSEGARAKLQLGAPLLPGERIDVTLTSGIHDLDGGALTPQVYHFTVSGAPGAGSFTGTDTAVGDKFPALGDLDGDGDLDIVRSNGEVHLSDGVGGFTFIDYEYSCYQTAGYVTLADVDADRDLDILCTGSQGVGSLWHNDGGAFVEAPAQDLLNGRSKLIPGDLDGDGDLDLYAATSSTDVADTILLNDGAGTFTLGAEDVGSVRTDSVVLADVDADGDLDVVFGTGSASESATWWRNDGQGGFTASDAALGGGPQPRNGVDVGDVDGDADADALVLPLFTSGARIWTNDGAGQFSEGHDLATDHVEDALLRDIDGDGDLDVVSVGHDFFIKQNLVWLGSGDGSFTPGPAFGVGGQGLALGDVDGDGIVDAVVGATLFLGD